MSLLLLIIIQLDFHYNGSVPHSFGNIIAIISSTLLYFSYNICNSFEITISPH
ncbi:hypothetical protein, partial [Plasmodium yoelii yoelii]